MKKVLLTILILGLLGFGFPALCADLQYTYEGEFDPAVFFSWDHMGTKYCDKGHRHDLWSNPDKNAEVKSVELVGELNKEGTGFVLVRYGYFKNGIEYIFILDSHKYHFKQIKLNDLKRVKNFRIKRGT